MGENRFFLKSSEMEGFAPARIGGQPAILWYDRLIAHVKRTSGVEAAALFAEPQLPRGSSGEAGTISWYGSRSGTISALDALEEGQRQVLAQKLADRLRMLAPALANEQFGPALASWLNIGSNSDILSVGGEPVLVNWAVAPKAVVSREQHAEHYAATLGRFAPQLPVPLGDVAAPAPTLQPVETGGTMAPAAGLASSGAANMNPAAAVAASRTLRGTAPLADFPPAPTPPLQPATAAAADAPAVLPTARRSAGSWAPWIATGLAAISLLVLSLPGVLVYPSVPVDTSVRDSFEEQRLRASNESLEAQYRALQNALSANQCRPANFVLPVPGLPAGPLAPDKNNPPGTEPNPQLQINPANPDRAQLPSSEPAGRESASTVGRLLERSTVLIIALKTGPAGRISLSLGSGFLISNRHIVTNHHVVEGVDPNRVFVANKSLGVVLAARIMALSQPPPIESDIRVDIGVLEIEPLPGNLGLKVGPTPSKLSTAYVAGYPAFLTERDSAFQSFVQALAQGAAGRDTIRQTMTQHHVEVPGVDLEEGRINNSMKTGSHALPILLHDMQLAKGNSGGPLVDTCGRVIGINTALFPSDAGTRQGNVAQDVSILRSFLTEKGVAFVSDEQACAAPAVTVAAPPPSPAATPTSTPAAQPAPSKQR